METAYFLLRIYAGGYHANEEKKCKILTRLNIVIGLLFITYFQISDFLLHILIGIGSLLIYELAPVENSKRKLGKYEKYEFKKKIRIILLVILLIYIIVGFICNKKIMKAITYDIIVISVGLIVEIVKKSKRSIENY